jgi:PLP dependent protein
MIEQTTQIQENIERVQSKIARAAHSAGRDPKGVQLVVVTKFQPLEVVRSVIEAGAQILGENYAEEAAGKIAALGGSAGVQWHMIGHVQSRKARMVCEHFDLMHSLDSLHLAAKLNQYAGELKRVLPVLIELNLGGEESKSGWMAADEAGWERIVPEIEQVLALPSLKVSGLMTMPPLGDDPEAARPFFVRLRHMQETLAKRYPLADWQTLSMGTSADFNVAVQEGATLVRVGQAIVGQRPRRI